MEKEEFNIIVAKYNAGKANPEEVRFLEAYYKALGVRPDFIDPDNNTEQFWNTMKSEIDLRIENHNLDQQHLKMDKVYKLWPRIAAAATILLTLSVGGYFLINRNVQPNKIAKVQPYDIAPGHNQATLTLANGQKIILTRGLSGKLAKRGNILIQINNHSTLAYTASAVNDNTLIEYNTMSTAKGEQSPFPLVLADGTKVWLNAQSSIIFPTTFHGSKRVVKIKGEAYFEVVHNSSWPFEVQANGQTIEDIGTHFNVNAYDDEPVIKTTLIEGSIRITKGTKTAIINPGQQAITRIGNNLITVENADLENAIAWKNGLFSFRKNDIQAVMRQFSRWYNVDIIYEGQIPHRLFNGEIHRNLNASKVLKVLSFYNVNFRIDGKKIIVKE